jgi:hypothetical protein
MHWLDGVLLIQHINMATDERSAQRPLVLRPNPLALAQQQVSLLSCCRFRGHRDKVFLEPEDGDATTEVQPRV